MIDWNKHPEAVRASLIYWDEFGKTVSRRVVSRPTQTKTVKDAVEWAGGEWRAFGIDGIAYNHKTKYFSYCDIDDLDEVSWQLICTREEFEAYVKEQEGEKWTHTYGSFGHKCKVLSVDGEHSWVLTEHGSKVTEYTSSLKPIKPAISESEAWRKAVLAGNMQHITDNYNVVAKD